MFERVKLAKICKLALPRTPDPNRPTSVFNLVNNIYPHFTRSNIHTCAPPFTKLISILVIGV